MPTYHSLPDLSGYKGKAARAILKLAKEHTEKQRELSAIGRQLEEARSRPPGSHREGYPGARPGRPQGRRGPRPRA